MKMVATQHQKVRPPWAAAANLVMAAAVLPRVKTAVTTAAADLLAASAKMIVVTAFILHAVPGPNTSVMINPCLVGQIAEKMAAATLRATALKMKMFAAT